MTCEELMTLFNEHISELPYANPSRDETSYGGWISNLKTRNKNSNPNQTMKLDINQENDLFLLFVLASCWSRTGKYESSAYFVVYLKDQRKNDPEYWKTLANFVREKKASKQTSEFIKNNYVQFSNRTISINENFFDSTYGVAKYWEDIKAKIELAKTTNDWKGFMDYLHSLKGLAGGAGFNYDGTYRPGKNKNGKETDPKMIIKIPLILREMRVALPSSYGCIPGKYCCIPDKRVRDAVKNNISDLDLGNATSYDTLIEQSSAIYQKFGDWYDIPLFAYEDLRLL